MSVGVGVGGGEWGVGVKGGGGSGRSRKLELEMELELELKLGHSLTTNKASRESVDVRDAAEGRPVFIPLVILGVLYIQRVENGSWRAMGCERA